MTLRALAAGDESDLWKAYEVKGTPTLLFEDRATGRTALVRGLAREPNLDAALAAVMKSPSKEKKESEPSKDKSEKAKEKNREK